MQDPIPAWERQEVFINNGSTADSGLAIVSTTETSGTVKSPVSLDIFHLAVNYKRFPQSYFRRSQWWGGWFGQQWWWWQRCWFCRPRKQGKRTACKVNARSRELPSAATYATEMKQRRALGKTLKPITICHQLFVRLSYWANKVRRLFSLSSQLTVSNNYFFPSFYKSAY